VDIIISEPMGILLVNERMLESFLYAKKWLKPDGRMYPTMSNLFCAPFQDDYLFMETFTKSTFWTQNCFYGVDMRSLSMSAFNEYFGMPVVDAFDPRILLAPPVRHMVDFLTAEETDLAEIIIPFSFHIQGPATVHGLAFWFDVLFAGTQADVWLSTGPTSALTHWYQVRCLIKDPILVAPGQELTGTARMVTNSRQSYDITIDMGVDGYKRTTNTLNLKDPFYRCSDYSTQAATAVLNNVHTHASSDAAMQNSFQDR